MLVGIDVAVGGGTVCVGMRVAVAGPGVVGSGLGAIRVGKGDEPKPNSAVGVGCVPTLVARIGLAVSSGMLRDPEGSKLNKPEQRQQNKSSPKEGIRILPACPCWLYFVFSIEINSLICSTIHYQ